MAITCAGGDRILEVRLSGEVDHHGARKMMDEISMAIDRELPRKLTVDLGGVTFMDSSGIAVLLRAYKRMGELGGSMAVRNVPEQAGRVLRAAGIGRLIKFE